MDPELQKYYKIGKNNVNKGTNRCSHSDKSS